MFVCFFSLNSTRFKLVARHKPTFLSSLGVHRQFLLTTIGWFVGYHITKYENYLNAKLDRDMMHYIKVHAEDFAPKGKNAIRVFLYTKRRHSNPTTPMLSCKTFGVYLCVLFLSLGGLLFSSLHPAFCAVKHIILDVNNEINGWWWTFEVFLCRCHMDFYSAYEND